LRSKRPEGTAREQRSNRAVVSCPQGVAVTLYERGGAKPNARSRPGYICLQLL
jgi:hypothetical protein